MKNKLFYLLIFFVFLSAFLLRFISLNKLPSGLDQDETAIGYNAFLINSTGRDEWGIRYPLYFKSFGDYKLPIYIYTVSFFERLIGVNSWAVRLPSAISGFLSVVVLFFLIKKLTNNNVLALSSSFLLAINPWSVFLSRAGFETNLATFFILLGLYLYYLFKDKYNLFFGVLSVIFFSLSIYTYNVTRVIAPLIFISLIIYDYFTSKFNKKNLLKVVFLLFLLFIFSLPFLMSLLNASGLKNDSSVLIFAGASKAQALEFRSYLIFLPSFFSKLFFNLPLLFLTHYISNLFAFFNIDFLFINGQDGMSGIGNNGEFYLFQLPLLIFGIIYFIKNIKTNKNLKKLNGFIIWFIVSLFVVALSSEIPHGTRDFEVIIPMTVFSGLGLVYIFNFFSNNKNIKFFLVILLSIIIGYSFMFFLVSYIFRFPNVYSSTWHPEDKSLAVYLKNNQAKYSKIYINSDTNFIYTSLVFYQKYDPHQYLKSVIYLEKPLFSQASSIGKYKFEDINFAKIASQKNILVVVSGKDNVSGFKLIKTFYYLTRPIVLFIDNKYAQFPVTDIVYKVYESN